MRYVLQVVRIVPEGFCYVCANRTEGNREVSKWSIGHAAAASGFRCGYILHKCNNPWNISSAKAAITELDLVAVASEAVG